MMDQNKWKQLKEEFENEKNFNEEGYYIKNGGYPDFDLMEWLDCDTTRPSLQMKLEFSRHGYAVYPGDRDSFGWLVGIVEDEETGRKITFG